MRKAAPIAIGSLVMAFGLSANAQVALNSLTSFGRGHGWLAPSKGAYGFFGTGNNERELASGRVAAAIFLLGLNAIAGMKFLGLR